MEETTKNEGLPLKNTLETILFLPEEFRNLRIYQICIKERAAFVAIQQAYPTSYNNLKLRDYSLITRWYKDFFFLINLSYPTVKSSKKLGSLPCFISYNKTY